MSLPGVQPSYLLVTVAQPAAGNDWFYTVPPSTWVRLIASFGVFTASATVAARWVGMSVYNAQGVSVPNLLGSISATTSSVPASDPQKVGWGNSFTWDSSGFQSSGNNTTIQTQAGGLILPPGFVLCSDTATIQATDQYSSIYMLFEAWAASPLYDAGSVLTF